MSKTMLVLLAVLATLLFVQQVASNHRTTGAVGVFTPCGIAAIVEIKGDGSITVYDVDNQAPQATLEKLVSLPEKQRIEIIAGCPTGMNHGQEKNQYEAQGPIPNGNGREIA